MRTKHGAGLRSPEKGTCIYCRVNSSQVMVATGRSAGPGPPSEPNAWLCAERVEGACQWEARAQERWSLLGGQWRAVGTGRRWWGGESGRR
jgi:hypothetical protein